MLTETAIMQSQSGLQLSSISCIIAECSIDACVISSGDGWEILAFAVVWRMRGLLQAAFGREFFYGEKTPVWDRLCHLFQ